MSMYRNGMPAADLAGLTWLRSQRSGRMFSPNPGQRNFPSLPFRNQFTRKNFGGCVSADCIWSQCWKYSPML